MYILCIIKNNIFYIYIVDYSNGGVIFLNVKSTFWIDFYLIFKYLFWKTFFFSKITKVNDNEINQQVLIQTAAFYLWLDLKGAKLGFIQIWLKINQMSGEEWVTHWNKQI